MPDHKIPTLDTEFVRAQFPAFAEESLRGQAFFENAGGSYTCGPVIERLTRFYRQRKVQPYGAFSASLLGGGEMDEARSRLAALLGVDGRDLSFGPSTTQNTYVLAQAFGAHLSPGDAIVVTNQDHEANSGPWRRLAQSGIEVREWQIDPDSGHLDIDALSGLLDDRVRLVCFAHCSNVVGEINPVAEICARVGDAGALSCVDGVSYAPHGLPDIGALGADIYLFSAYKTYGPHQGIMVIRQDVAEKLPNQGHYFNADTACKRFTPAGPDHAQIAASAGIADYIDSLYAHHFADRGGAVAPAARAAAVHDLMRAHETTLLQPVLDYLNQKNSVRLIGPTTAGLRAPTVSVALAGSGASAAAALAPLGVMAG
ncbi:MAG: aminotransferase class V-fold PLP-dependent enzyme, partial [Halocynthiibacter sp.]